MRGNPTGSGAFAHVQRNQNCRYCKGIDFLADEEGIFTAQDYIDVLGFDSWEDGESEDEKR